MTCPSRWMGWLLVWIHGFKVSIDHIVIALLLTGRLAKLELLNVHLGAQILEYAAPNLWDEQQKADSIGEKTRSKQQGPRKQDHRTTGQGLRWVTEAAKALP